ncbi:MAG: helix-turn-helix domain-containing protein [Thermodesulfobacteriota bacterium]
MNKFGEQLKSLRESKNLALTEASRLLSIPQSRLVELERGIRIPTPGQVERLEKFFQVHPGMLAALMQ